MNAATIVAYGEALWDLLPSGPVLGGAPLNFAYRIHSLGYRGVMISRVGNDAFGKQALEQMAALGMDTAFIQQGAEHPTGAVEIYFDEHKNPDYTIIPEVAYDYIDYSEQIAELIQEAECLCFGSLAQRSAGSRATLNRILDAFCGPYALYDINLRKNCYTPEIIRASMERSTILKLNHEEMVELAAMYGIPAVSMQAFSDALFRQTPLQYCLITLGAQGAFAASCEGEAVYEPGYKVTLIDPCGSGDAFSAGFLHTLLQGGGLREACRFGNALGAMVAEQPGATQVITPPEIEVFMQARETVEVTTAFSRLC